MDSVGYLRAIRTRWACVAISVGLFVLIGLNAPPSVGAPSSPSTDLTEAASPARERYVSAAVIGTPPTGPTATSSLVTQVGPEFATLVFYLRNAALLSDFGRRIGYVGADPAVLQKLLVLKADPQSGTVTVTGTGGTRQQAVEITSEFIVAAQTYFAGLQNQATSSVRRATRHELTRLQKRLERLSAQLDRLRPARTTPGTRTAPSNETTLLESQYRTTLASYTDAYNRLAAGNSSVASVDFVIVQPPTLETVQKQRPSLVYWMPLRLAIGLLLGLLVGIAIALLLEHYNRRLSTRTEVERIFGRPLLAQLPHQLLTGRVRDVRVAVAPMSLIAKSYDSLAALTLRRQSGDLVGVMADEDEVATAGGPVTVRSSRGGSVRLAEPADKVPTSSVTVLLLGSAGHARAFGVVVANLATALAQRSGRPVKVLRRPDRHDHLLPEGVLHAPGPDGHDEPATAVTVAWPLSENGQPEDPTALATALTDEGCIVVIDAGEVLSPEFAAAAAAADVAIVVCEHRRTRIDDAQRSATVVRLSGVRLLGPVLAQDRTVHRLGLRKLLSPSTWAAAARP